MRITRIYQAIIRPVLDHTASHYLAHVLRCRIGDECILFNGHGLETNARIVDINKTGVTVSLGQTIENHRESPLTIHLAQAIAKGDKMDWILQKATELGVHDITPLRTDYSEVKLSEERLAKKLMHWQGILISAAEQSGRAILPRLNPPCLLKDLSITDPTFFLSPRAPQSLSAFAQTSLQRICVCIGPEGGFSEQEENIALQQGMVAMTLGKRILRTETAAVSAIAAAQTLWGDFL